MVILKHSVIKIKVSRSTLKKRNEMDHIAHRNPIEPEQSPFIQEENYDIFLENAHGKKPADCSFSLSLMENEEQSDEIIMPLNDSVFLIDFELALNRKDTEGTQVFSEESKQQNQAQLGKKVAQALEKDLSHLTCRRKRQKNKFEQKTAGYATKNFLQLGKLYHFKFLLKKLGRERFIRKYPKLKEMMGNKGITLLDYEFLYSIPEFRDYWQQFFNKKNLYRDLLISRSQNDYRMIYLMHMNKFEEAFDRVNFKGQEGEDRISDLIERRK